MAALTTLTPCHATSLHFSNRISHHYSQNQNVYINHTKRIHKAKSSLLSYHHPNPSLAFPSLSSQATSIIPSTHFSTSGSGSSWLQDTTMNHDASSCRGLREGSIYSAFPTQPAQVSAVQDLYDFICSGPLLDKVGLTAEKVAESIDKWLFYGSKLCRLFQLNELYLTIPEKARFYHYYIPVFFWCEDQISEHRSKFKDEEEIPPLVIGFSAPQGCGKTTLVFALDYLFRITGRKSATLSIDDFYLTADGQAKLREENPGNALLELRGNAGSHDLPFSVETLTALSKLTKEGMKMKLPRYDKSAYRGKGDRADPSIWPEVEGPLTVILYEGWMLGFKPLPTEVVKAVDPQLETVNKNLEAYYDAWDKFIKAWIVIKIQDPSCVYRWRLQAEIAMRDAGKPGMSDEEVSDFVSRYLPAYKAYLPTLYSEGPNGSDPKHLLVIEIDEGRNPILFE
ncbi:D-glycerate 3-kinase, chloroplastic-like isoform X1 [Hibiscus syriacus]|uniref:D-glycerate 3-kinase, chloroplastic-like isoform X1 n=1 Tax=Hibiscus syriacus TaxID=106335 RepID=UPI00192298E4|nr:D-glycerate 3-kinase, chloroplastic-like isoform X1 [Hibiscus syriacus]XP_039038286.1 D-glycerate 3-kinase, chloroplastic-like isoform X1 [Hibiscus syriacus]